MGVQKYSLYQGFVGCIGFGLSKVLCIVCRKHKTARSVQTYMYIHFKPTAQVFVPYDVYCDCGDSEAKTSTLSVCVCIHVNVHYVIIVQSTAVEDREC